MNYDSGTSPAAPQPSTDHDVNAAPVAGDRRDEDRRDDRGRSNEPDQPRSTAETARRHKAGLAKKLQFMTNLMKNFDMLVYAELCTLYYMDCSFFRFILRSIPHSVFLSPKSEDFLMFLPAHRPHVFAIFVPNIVCMLLHILWSIPEAGETMRGYLHGGVIIDFIGQKPPKSKLAFLLLDLVVLGLQCFMLAIHAERERLRKIVLPPRRTSSGAGITTVAVPVTTQDHDAEERGVLRDEPAAVETPDGIELQPLSGGSAPQTTGSNAEGSRLSRRNAHHGEDDPDLTDVLRSGNAILSDFHIIHAIRTAGNDYQSAAAHSIQTLGYTTSLMRLATERRARAEARRAQQP